MPTDIVLDPHASTLLAFAKILAYLFCSVMQTHRWDEKLFEKVADFLSINLTLTPAADIFGSASGSVLKPLAFTFCMVSLTY